MEKNITVTYGAGKGATTLAAFDAALLDAGIGNYNLIHLSSIIPVGCVPVVQKAKLNDDENFGDRMYVVIAEQRETRKGHEAWAGLGWVSTATQPRKGLFVEHCGENEDEVMTKINKSLASMTEYRKESYGPIQHKTMGITCQDEPVCAVVAAIYDTEGWKRSSE